MLIQVLDLSHISPELAYAAEDADLVVMEGMVRKYCLLNLYYECCYDAASLFMKHVSIRLHEFAEQGNEESWNKLLSWL